MKLSSRPIEYVILTIFGMILTMGVLSFYEKESGAADQDIVTAAIQISKLPLIRKIIKQD